MTMTISHHVLTEIINERTRQHAKFSHEPLATDMDAAIIMGEEYGEICRAVCQNAPTAVTRKEIVELAAVCIAHLDGDLHFGNEK
jgi:hypothetical protein